MTENQYIELLTSNRRCGDKSSCETVALIDRAVEAYPNSATLWCLRGDIIQMGSEDIPYEISEALRSYQEAIRVDPGCAEAYESLGYYLDVHTQEYEKAEEAFRKALDLEQRIDTYVGLARVLAELGRDKNDILAFLDASPFGSGSIAIAEIRAEIVEGTWFPE